MGVASLGIINHTHLGTQLPITTFMWLYMWFYQTGHIIITISVIFEAADIAFYLVVFGFAMQL